MELDVALQPAGESNSLHTQNPDDEEFRRILVLTEDAQKSPLTMKLTLKEIHHGKLKWERLEYEGTLLVFQFHFKSKLEGRRYRNASITLEFHDAGGKPSHDPAVYMVSPSPDHDRYLNRTTWSRERKVGANVSVKPPWVDIGARMENKDTKNIDFSARLSTETHWSEKKSSGSENTVTWSMEENTGKKDGIPSFLQAAVLLRRTTIDPVRVKLCVKSEVDWKSNVWRLLPVRSDVDRVIDPFLLTPGVTQKGVDNSHVTGVVEEDLQAMEKLPMADYYKLIHLAQEE